MLYHGTAREFVASILTEGLKPQLRQQVHLSIDEATAHRVGQRHGVPAILVVQAGRMHECGSKFFLADNGVWLTDYVPPEFLSMLSPTEADSAATMIVGECRTVNRRGGRALDRKNRSFLHHRLRG